MRVCGFSKTLFQEQCFFSVCLTILCTFSKQIKKHQTQMWFWAAALGHRQPPSIESESVRCELCTASFDRIASVKMGFEGTWHHGLHFHRALNHPPSQNGCTGWHYPLSVTSAQTAARPSFLATADEVTPEMKQVQRTSPPQWAMTVHQFNIFIDYIKETEVVQNVP